jgi:Tol biopolymer transport system component
MNADGSSPVGIPSSATLTSVPVWAADWERTAFAGGYYPNYGIWVANVNGSSASRLLANTSSCGRSTSSVEAVAPSLPSPRTLCGALALAFALLGCSNPDAPGSTVGDIHLTVTTTGLETAMDPDGYTVAVDNGGGETISTNNGSVTFSALTPGDHYLVVGGVAINCTVTGGNPLRVSVTAGKMVEVSVVVTCASVGSVRITVTPSGGWLPANGYMISVDGGPGINIPTDGGFVRLPDLPAGDHSVGLNGPSWNCTVADPNPGTVTVVIGATAQVTFKVACVAGATGGQIAFASDRGGCPEIYVMNADGSGVGELVNTHDGYCSRFNNDAAWSPDGSRIAYDDRPNIGWENQWPWIAVLNANGSRTVLISKAADPAWSPDGTRIAGTTWYPICTVRGCSTQPATNSPQIFVANADGSSLVVLAAGATPSWSPDGRLIFANLGDIYVMNADGTGVTNLTNNAASNDGPAWSPDGTKIAFRSSRSGVVELYVMNTDGSGVIALTADAAAEGRPAWSSDGKRIAFASDKDGDAEIYVMNADGSGVIKLTDNAGFDARPAWAR